MHIARMIGSNGSLVKKGMIPYHSYRYSTGVRLCRSTYMYVQYVERCRTRRSDKPAQHYIILIKL